MSAAPSPRRLVVRMLDGTVYKIEGVTSWVEPPMFPPEGDRPVLQNTEIEISEQDARDTERRLRAALATGDPLVTGRDWTYTPACSQSMFVQAFDQDGVKLGSFNPHAVESVYYEATGDVVA